MFNVDFIVSLYKLNISHNVNVYTYMFIKYK